MQKESISFIILAAGMGNRMRSKIPKVLHNLAGEPIIFHILRKILSLSKKITLKKIIVVLGHESELVKNTISAYFPNIDFAFQSNQYGTAHAVLSAKKTLKNTSGKALILCGDTPLISTKLILDLIKLSKKVDLGVSVFKTETPFGYGRIVLNKFNEVTAIIEEKDANKSQKMINLCNAGIYISDINLLFRLLSKVKINSNKREMYLTDIIDIAHNKKIHIGASYSEEIENIGINNRESLAMAEKEMQNIIRSKVMKNGVTLVAPETVFFSHDTKISRDVYIAPNVVFGP
jgi:bifunctional UDP-N-acetylglucosamine pyrophosphorylase/glucosamine-1-phosphate N-acetyltransferase